MLRKKILVVIGTRPEAIKMFPLINLLRAESNHFDVKLCVTGQHKEMVDDLLKQFAIVADVDLNIMRQGQDLFDITTAVLFGLKSVLEDFSMDLVIVHGDTTTAFASALAAFYSRVPVAHVEAGLRTFDLDAPYPEEANRQLITKLARWHFTPTEESRSNLRSEKVASGCIFVTGNTVIDSLFETIKVLESNKGKAHAIITKLNGRFGFDVTKHKYILVTCHRRENLGSGLVDICKGLKLIADAYKDVRLLAPIHPNPDIRKIFLENLSGAPNIVLVTPLNYLEFVTVLQNCYIVLTDSGGLQEEAPSLGKPVLVMRDRTERPEGLSAGTLKLVGTKPKVIFEQVSRMLDSKTAYSEMSCAINPYGDGQASARILKSLRDIFSFKVQL